MICRIFRLNRPDGDQQEDGGQDQDGDERGSVFGVWEDERWDRGAGWYD